MEGGIRGTSQLPRLAGALIVMAACLWRPQGLDGQVGQDARPAPSPSPDVESPGPESDLTCSAEIFPGMLTAPSQPPPSGARRSLRLAGRVTLRARISENLDVVNSARVPGSSGIRISLSDPDAPDPARPPADPRDQRPAEDPRVILFDVDVSEASAGVYPVTFRGASGKECVGTLRIRQIGGG